MTTFVPRAPYTKEELSQLYPQELELQLVQVVSLSIIIDLCLCTDTVLAPPPWLVYSIMPRCMSARTDQSDQEKEALCHLASRM